MVTVENLLARRATIDELHQNFRSLKDLLQVKFSEIENTKDAVRDLLIFNKYFQPIYTQQLVGKNLENLKSAKKDLEYSIYQREHYEQLLEDAEHALAVSKTHKNDKETRAQLDELEKRHICNGEWEVEPRKIIGNDFVSDLLQSSIEDLRQREMRSTLAESSYTTLVRRAF